jgi:hypothetical protein
MLARDLGMTVEELGERLTAPEYQEWQALYVVEAKERKHAADKAKAGMR